MEKVYFGFDVYTLSDAAKQSLEKAYDCLQANKDRNIAVVGHTDARGTVEYNIGLSDDRAQAVITYLGRLGIDPARMHKVPKGSGEARGASEAGYAEDRRVEFVWE
jgi:outer membrane protein OmpA-like peptidoglycan-associated protein